jgi:hypothetical protein
MGASPSLYPTRGAQCWSTPHLTESRHIFVICPPELIFVIAALVLYLWTKELFPKFFLFPQEEPTKDKHDKFGEALAKYLRER